MVRAFFLLIDSDVLHKIKLFSDFFRWLNAKTSSYNNNNVIHSIYKITRSTSAVASVMYKSIAI